MQKELSRGNELNSKDVKITFTRSDDFEESLTGIANSNIPTLLVVGNGDRDLLSVPKVLPSNLIKMYVQNSFVSDGERIFTLPIGIENLSHGRNGLPKLLRSSLSFEDRRNQILIGPFGNSHSDRSKFSDIPENESFYKILNRMSPKEYSRASSEFKFVACPRGNGVDTHRFWETLYRGSIPIVINDEWAKSLNYLGLTFLKVEEWSPAALLDLLDSNTSIAPSNPLTTDSLWMNFWRDMFYADLQKS